MADLFDEAPEAAEDSFDLPGDDELLAATTAAQEAAAEEGPDPVSEAGRLLRAQRDKPEEVAETEDSVEGEVPADAGIDPAAELLDKYLAKYDGDMDKALKAAANQDSLLGRQAQELGEARQAVEQWAQWAQYQQQLAAQQQAQPQSTDGWEEFIEENPAQATQVAYAQGNAAAYQAAARVWDEISPGAPQNWYDNMQIKGALVQQHQQQQYAAQEAHGVDLINHAVQRYPDLPDHIDRMVEIAPQYPHEVMALASGDLNVAVPAMESLYLKARGATSDTLVNTAQEIARKQTEEELRVRQEASVASASRTGVEPPPTAAEAIAADWPSDDALAAGWNVGGAAP